MKILIIGDSFAADYTKKYPGKIGWPNMLSNDFDVTNLAQAGCSEYKIYKQLVSVNLDDFDVVVVCHTSPYRIYVSDHPVHHGDPLHANSDLIYSDIKQNLAKSPNLSPIVDFFEKYFDLEHARFVHNLICEKIECIIDKTQTHGIHIINLDQTGLHMFKNQLDFNHLFQSNRGEVNHFDDAGNREIYQKIKDRLLKLS